ncbi:MAG: hypothetical protein J3Q66DRAFT_321862 [Benniella sp.]|nr:MAG: hypothetical protein J3Q66DRAFT_321862 [Benniella sp.]
MVRLAQGVMPFVDQRHTTSQTRIFSHPLREPLREQRQTEHQNGKSSKRHNLNARKRPSAETGDNSGSERTPSNHFISIPYTPTRSWHAVAEADSPVDDYYSHGVDLLPPDYALFDPLLPDILKRSKVGPSITRGTADGFLDSGAFSSPEVPVATQLRFRLQHLGHLKRAYDKADEPDCVYEQTNEVNRDLGMRSQRETTEEVQGEDGPLTDNRRTRSWRRMVQRIEPQDPRPASCESALLEDWCVEGTLPFDLGRSKRTQTTRLNEGHPADLPLDQNRTLDITPPGSGQPEARNMMLANQELCTDTASVRRPQSGSDGICSAEETVQKEVGRPSSKGRTTDGTGLRRSMRQKIKPLEYWRNERAMYSCNNDSSTSPPIKPVADPVRPTSSHQKQIQEPINAKQTKKKQLNDNDDSVIRPGGSGTGVGEEYTHQQDTRSLARSGYAHPFQQGTVIDYKTGAAVRRLVAEHPHQSHFQGDPDSCFHIHCGLEDASISSGTVQIAGNGQKLRRAASKAMIFYILKGRMKVCMHNTSITVSQGDSFLVSIDSEYEIQNLLQSTSTLFFATSK